MKQDKIFFKEKIHSVIVKIKKNAIADLFNYIF